MNKAITAIFGILGLTALSALFYKMFISVNTQLVLDGGPLRYMFVIDYPVSILMSCGYLACVILIMDAWIKELKK